MASGVAQLSVLCADDEEPQSLVPYPDSPSPQRAATAAAATPDAGQKAARPGKSPAAVVQARCHAMHAAAGGILSTRQIRCEWRVRWFAAKIHVSDGARRRVLHTTELVLTCRRHSDQRRRPSTRQACQTPRAQAASGPCTAVTELRRAGQGSVPKTVRRPVAAVPSTSTAAAARRTMCPSRRLQQPGAAFCHPWRRCCFLRV